MDNSNKNIFYCIFFSARKQHKNFGKNVLVYPNAKELFKNTVVNHLPQTILNKTIVFLSEKVNSILFQIKAKHEFSPRTIVNNLVALNDGP